MLLFSHYIAGKSTLINNLANNKSCKAGIDISGVTKNVQVVKTANYEVYDTPGIGSPEIPFLDILQELETSLEGKTVATLLFVFKCINTRWSISQDITTKLYGLCFKDGLQSDQEKEKSWKNVIFIGTFSDKATDDEKRFFSTKVLDKFNKEFAKEFVAKVHKVALISNSDISELTNLLPASKGEMTYTTPPASEALSTVCNTLQIPENEAITKLTSNVAKLLQELQRNVMKEKYTKMNMQCCGLPWNIRQMLKITVATTTRGPFSCPVYSSARCPQVFTSSYVKSNGVFSELP